MKTRIAKRFELPSIIAVALVAWCAEAHLLMEILNHPAGPPAQSLAVGPAVFLATAAVPYALLVMAWVIGADGRRGRRALVYVFAISTMGVLFGALALHQYGHATPGFLMAGFGLQALLFIRFALKG